MTYAGCVTINKFVFASKGRESFKPHELQSQIFASIGEAPVTVIKVEGLRASASVMSQLLQIMAGLKMEATGLKELSLQGFSGANGPID